MREIDELDIYQEALRVAKEQGALSVKDILAEKILKLWKTTDGQKYLLEVVAPLAGKVERMKKPGVPPVDEASKQRDAASNTFFSALVVLHHQDHKNIDMVTALDGAAHNKPQ